MQIGIGLRLQANSGGWGAYAAGGFTPAVVADFTNSRYRKSTGGTTFAGLLTHSRAGNATMTDSAGLLKWAPHNLALNSATPATQSITVISGAVYTVAITGTGSFALSGAGSGTVTDGAPVTVTASTTTLTLTKTGSPSTMWCYRSDLGGMADNPDTGSSYVPTTSAAVYLPRRNHYVGGVNKGVLLESAAATNLALYSNDFTNAAWTKTEITVTAAAATGPDGIASMTKLAENVTTTAHAVATASVSTTSGTVYTASFIVKKGDGVGAPSIIQVTMGAALFGVGQYANFNLDTGAFLTTTGGTAAVKSLGSGLYAISWTATATATSSNLGGIIAFTNNNDGTGRAPSYLGATNRDVFIGFAQFEAGSVPTSYIPTTSATVTRAAETLTIAAENMAYSATAMSFSIEGEVNFADTALNPEVTPWRWQASGTEYIRNVIRTDGARTGQGALQAYFATAEDESAGSTTGYTPGLSVTLNEAARVTTTAIQGATKGTAATADSALGDANMPAVSGTAIDIGHLFNGTLSQFRMWGVDIGATGIAAAST